MGTYGTATAATLIPAFMIRPQNKVLLGTGGQTDLETTSWCYSVYSAPIGFASGCGLDLGLLADLAWKTVPTIEPIAGVNFQERTVYEVTGEDCEVVLTLTEFKVGVLVQAVATGRLYVLEDEALITFGGGCTLPEYPLAIEFTNVACNAPSVPNIGAGVTGGIITLYKTIQTSGLDLSGISAGAQLQTSLTFKAIPDTTKSRRNRLGNMYLY